MAAGAILGTLAALLQFLGTVALARWVRTPIRLKPRPARALYSRRLQVAQIAHLLSVVGWVAGLSYGFEAFEASEQAEILVLQFGIVWSALSLANVEEFVFSRKDPSVANFFWWDRRRFGFALAGAAPLGALLATMATLGSPPWMSEAIQARFGLTLAQADVWTGLVGAFGFFLGAVISLLFPWFALRFFAGLSRDETAELFRAAGLYPTPRPRSRRTFYPAR
ncbi:MAG: hypothetical protein AAF430_25525 [Myxococcota bacterium]